MRLGFFQMNLVWEDVEANISKIESNIHKFKSFDILVLPEMFASGFTMKSKIKVAEKYDYIFDKMCHWAKSTQTLILGSTTYKANNNYYNRMIVAFPNGKALFYDKRHCFTMGEEAKHFQSGNKNLIFEYKGIRIATFICYDLRFPVWSRNEDAYDIAIYSANWPKVRRNVWNILLKARAIENQCYVIGANRCGVDGNGYEHSGDSAIIDSKGNIIIMAKEGEEDIYSVDIDINELYKFRQNFPVLKDRDIFKIEI